MNNFKETLNTQTSEKCLATFYRSHTAISDGLTVKS